MPETALSSAAREAVLDRLERERFDCVVIGGGISGAGVARHAAQRGLSAALLEADDFAAGQPSTIVLPGQWPSWSVQTVASHDGRYLRLRLVPFFSEIAGVGTVPSEGETTEATTTVQATTVQLPTLLALFLSEFLPAFLADFVSHFILTSFLADFLPTFLVNLLPAFLAELTLQFTRHGSPGSANCNRY